MIAIDTNILIYAQAINQPPPKHIRSLEILDWAARTRAIIPIQVYAEFLNVCRRKLLAAPATATDQVNDYALLFMSPQTEHEDVIVAALLSGQCNLQYFDAVILTVAARAGATLLLSENMHDGLVIEGVRIVNSFGPANEVVIAEALHQAAWASIKTGARYFASGNFIPRSAATSSHNSIAT